MWDLSDCVLGTERFPNADVLNASSVGTRRAGHAASM